MRDCGDSNALAVWFEIKGRKKKGKKVWEASADCCFWRAGVRSLAVRHRVLTEAPSTLSNVHFSKGPFNHCQKSGKTGSRTQVSVRENVFNLTGAGSRQRLCRRVSTTIQEVTSFQSPPNWTQVYTCFSLTSQSVTLIQNEGSKSWPRATVRQTEGSFLLPVPICRAELQQRI